MKIVILEKEEGLGIGGIGIYNERLRHYLEKKGQDVRIIRFANKRSSDPKIFTIPYHFAEKRGFIFVPSERALTRISQQLKKFKPDIVHFSIGISPLDLMVPLLCHKLKIPVLGIWHSDLNNGTNAYSLLSKSLYIAYLPVCRQLDKLVVFSQKMKEFYAHRGLSYERIKIIPNGINAKFYKPGISSFAKKNGIKNGILFLGRLTIQKNPRVLLDSFLALNPSLTTKLVMVGDGDEKESLQDEYKDPKIIFTGLIKNEKTKLDIIRSCQIFVLPSFFEGMSLALLEAMSTGLACITSDAGNHSELLAHTGITIPISNLKQELPLALRILLSHADITKMFGSRARQKVKKLYSQETNFGKLVKTYRETIADYQRRGYPQTSPLEISLAIREKLKNLWQKAKKLGANYLLGEE